MFSSCLSSSAKQVLSDKFGLIKLFDVTQRWYDVIIDDLSELNTCRPLFGNCT